jgi:PHD/YefM family antitoxin component YafN of YafNO toxin-antitoxin module
LAVKRKDLCVSNRNIPLIFKGFYLRLNAYKNRGVLTMNINKRYIVDEEGNPKEVIIPLDDYRKIEELLGWDLDDKTIKQLREAKKDRDSGNKEAYVDLASI